MKFRLKLYQLSYPAKIQNCAIYHCGYYCELQTKQAKANKYIIHIEIMKYAIYAKSAQLNSVFCTQILNSFVISQLLDLSKGRQLLYGIMVEFDQCTVCLLQIQHCIYISGYPKGQLISNGLFGTLNSSKNEQKNRTNYYDTSGGIVFVRFLEELKTPKIHFELN